MAIIPETGEVVIKRQPEILEDIINRQKELINPNFENRHDGVISEMNYINSEMFALSNEFLEAIRDCWDVDRAEGFALDNLLALKRLRRIPPSRSRTNKQMFIGRNGVVIPQGRILRNISTGDEFYTVGRNTLTTRNCVLCEFTVGSVEVNQTYRFNIDGYISTYISEPGDGVSDILSKLWSNFIALNPPSEYFIQSFDGGTVLEISRSENFELQFIDLVLSSNLSATTVYTYGAIEAVEEGPIVAPSNSITEFLVPISGIIDTVNEGVLTVGRLKETDEEFRIRGKNTNIAGGVGTIPTIENSLLSNVEGVSSAIVIENDKGVVDPEGRPPKSYEIVIVGGDDEIVAVDVFRTKPSGIETVGNTTEIVVDQNGIPRTVKFTRPSPLEVLVRVTYTIYDEEILPISANNSIIDIVVEHINSLGLDKDIIPGRLFGPIYSEVQGIDDLLIEIDVGGGWTTDRVPVSITQYATTNSDDVTVIVDEG